MRLALQPGLNALLASSQQLVHAQGCAGPGGGGCECVPCAHFPDDLLVRNSHVIVEIRGIEDDNCTDCALVNGLYQLPLTYWIEDAPFICGTAQNYVLSRIPPPESWGTAIFWGVEARVGVRGGVTRLEVYLVIERDCDGDGLLDYYDYGLFGWFDPRAWAGYPFPPEIVADTEQARAAIGRLCAGETVELPFAAQRASGLFAVGPAGCRFDNAQILMRIDTQQNCASSPTCAQQSYIAIAPGPNCTWDWSVVNGAGCDCSGVEIARTESEVCVEITCPDGSRRISCASVGCLPDEGDCASQVGIALQDDFCLPLRWQTTIPTGCECQVVPVPTLDVSQTPCFDITCADGSARRLCVENPCRLTQEPCLQHHVEFHGNPPQAILVPDWEHSCPCIGPFDEFFSRYVSEKYDVLFEYNLPLQYTCLFNRQRWEVDLTLLNQKFMLREKLFSGPCSLGRRIDFSGYRAEGRSCDGLPYVVETEVTTEFETDPITQEPVEYTRIRWYEYFVEAIEVHLPGGVFFTANKYRVGELRQQGAHGMPDFVQRGSCLLVGSADTRLFDNTTMDQNAIGNQLRTGPCLGNRYCETRALSDFESWPDWFRYCPAALEEGEVRWCLSLACAA